MTISCAYRLYPSWFGDVDPLVPIGELAQGAARAMGRVVLRVEKIGTGFTQRSGYFVDYRVTYSSTGTTDGWPFNRAQRKGGS
jgi:hypothetical protein